MLRKCTVEEFNRYLDFSYELALDPTRSGYPSYLDGIKTKDTFVEIEQRAFQRDTDEILLFEQYGEVLGWIHYYILPDDRYLSTNSFNISRDTEQALAEFIEFAEEHYGGYDLYLGFPAENTGAIDYLSENGFECIEADYNNTAFIDKCDLQPCDDGIIRIDSDNYGLFERLHRQIEGEMYWNSERILNDLHEWTVFVKMKDDETLGAVYYTDASDDWYEIFGIDLKSDVFDPDVFQQLLSIALWDVKNRNGRFVTFFCEKQEEEIALKAGFECIGGYRCYHRKLNEYRYIDLREVPDLKEQAAKWFHDKWHIPEEAYLECMDEYLRGKTEYGWYLCTVGKKIIGGLGVIDNDFHERKDLYPNICAVYVEEENRRQGIAGRLLNMAVEKLREKGVTPVYLLTDHIGFYERYGWEFFCSVQSDDGNMSRMYVHK